MPSAAAYQRILLNGIPFWSDAQGTLYYYETSTQPTPTNRICLGSQASGLNPEWKTLLSSRLTEYRMSASSRSRATAPPKT